MCTSAEKGLEGQIDPVFITSAWTELVEELQCRWKLSAAAETTLFN